MPSQPIADETAERSVLGSMMMSPACIPDVLARLRPTDFHVLFHEAIYRTILTMTEQGKPVDATTLLSQMDTGDLARGGGGSALFEIYSSTPTSANVQFYVDIVIDRAQKRGLQRAAERIGQLAEASEMPADELVETSRDELESVVRGTSGLHLLYDDFLEYRPTFGLPVAGLVPTPWTGLDDLIDGFAPGRVYILAARPSVGKSLAAAQIALSIGTEGAVALSSLEMTRRELVMRMTANLANVPIDVLQGARRMDEATRVRRLKLAEGSVRAARVYLDDRAAVTPTLIGSYARTVARRAGPLRALVVDYLQLMTLGRKSESRQNEVSTMSRAMKLLAKDLDVPLIVLSQLNRDVEHRANRVPILADLRESGSLEQDSDVVIFLSMEMEEDPLTGDEVESLGTTRMTVAKNRHGRLGYFLLEKEGEYSRLTERPRFGPHH